MDEETKRIVEEAKKFIKFIWRKEASGILLLLYQEGDKNWYEMRKTLQIPPNALTFYLKRLKEFGLVDLSLDTYSLTKDGKELVEIIYKGIKSVYSR